MKAKLEDFKAGAVLYYSWATSVDEVIITKEPYDPKCCKFYINSFGKKERMGKFVEIYYKSRFTGGGIITERSLGDAGIEDYRYDNRPCRFYTTLKSAQDASVELEEWNHRIKDILFPLDADYWDEEDEGEE